MEQTRTTKSTTTSDGSHETTETIVGTFDPQSFKSLGSPGEYRVMKGIAPKERKDLDIANASFKGMLSYVGVRADDIKTRAGAAHFLVDTKNSKITLVLEEYGGNRPEGGSYTPSFRLVASSSFTQDQKDVASLMAQLHRPHDLAMKLRELPHLFSDEAKWKDTVKILRGLSTRVSKTITDTSNEDTGKRESALLLVIEDGAVACEWNFRYRVYEGTDPVEVPVRILYEADAGLTGVFARIHNPHKREAERKALETMMDNTITEIRKSIGDALPFIFVNDND